ncbi:MAG TPA: STAS domain-containing protein [Bacteroidota bacterium]|jgi:anti-sigma B factor antagonist|nr:STAS domain-containing protein [Bacteroidota bacterium]
MNEFKVRQRQKENITIVELQGYLDAHTAPILEQSFEDLLKEHRYNILVNCKNLEYISSAGLGVFMAFLDEVRKNNGDIKFSNMSVKIFNIFDLLGFPVLYEIYKDEQEAIVNFLDSRDSDKKKKA